MRVIRGKKVKQKDEIAIRNGMVLIREKDGEVLRRKERATTHALSTRDPSEVTQEMLVSAAISLGRDIIEKAVGLSPGRKLLIEKVVFENTSLSADPMVEVKELRVYVREVSEIALSAIASDKSRLKTIINKVAGKKP